MRQHQKKMNTYRSNVSSFNRFMWNCQSTNHLLAFISVRFTTDTHVFIPYAPIVEDNFSFFFSGKLWKNISFNNTLVPKILKNVCFIRNTGRLCHFQGKLLKISFCWMLNCGYVDARATVIRQNMCDDFLFFVNFSIEFACLKVNY